MASVPGSFDGARGDVVDDHGEVVARVELVDQRVQDDGPYGKPGLVSGQVFGRFEDADEAWVERLPRAMTGGSRRRGASDVRVAIALDTGARLEDVLVAHPWRNAPDRIESVLFQLLHEEF